MPLQNEILSLAWLCLICRHQRGGSRSPMPRATHFPSKGRNESLSSGRGGPSLETQQQEPPPLHASQVVGRAPPDPARPHRHHAAHQQQKPSARRLRRPSSGGPREARSHLEALHERRGHHSLSPCTGARWDSGVGKPGWHRGAQGVVFVCFFFFVLLFPREPRGHARLPPRLPSPLSTCTLQGAKAFGKLSSPVFIGFS